MVSVSLGRETIAKIQDILRKRNFRNKSHIVEEAILKFWEGEGR